MTDRLVGLNSAMESIDNDITHLNKVLISAVTRETDNSLLDTSFALASEHLRSRLFLKAIKVDFQGRNTRDLTNE